MKVGFIPGNVVLDCQFKLGVPNKLPTEFTVCKCLCRVKSGEIKALVVQWSHSWLEIPDVKCFLSRVTLIPD